MDGTGKLETAHSLQLRLPGDITIETRMSHGKPLAMDCAFEIGNLHFLPNVCPDDPSGKKGCLRVNGEELNFPAFHATGGPQLHRASR